MHQAKQQQQQMVPGHVPTTRSMTVPSARLNISTSEQSPVYRTDTPQQRWEPQRGYTAIRNYGRSYSQTGGRVPIPAWVYEIDASRPGHCASALGECVPVFDEQVSSDRAGYSDTGEAKVRRDSATPTHAELFFAGEGSSLKPGMLMVYESRSDAYRNIQTPKPDTGSAFSSLSLQKENRMPNAWKPRMDSTESYQRDTNTATPQPSLRRLSLRLPASPPLSEDMFDAITGDGDVDVENVVGLGTDNMLLEGMFVRWR
jgi:hypothetical protein